MDMSTERVAAPDATISIASRIPQRLAIISIGIVVAAVIVGYVIIGVRSIQSEGLIDARLKAISGRLEREILVGSPRATATTYAARARHAVLHPPRLLPVQFVQVDMLDTTVKPPVNLLVSNPARHRAVLVDGPFLAQVTHSGKAASTTIQSGTDSLRVFVAPLHPPPGTRWVGVIEVFEKVDGTSPSM